MKAEQVLVIDGSQGEGGGQILRSTIGLSATTGKALQIENIRAGRRKPGLMRQHLTAIHAAGRICNAKITGAEPGSQRLAFEPQQVCSGNYEFSIGTAGSATLVLQAILPALITAVGDSEIVIEGGTHNQWAPPFDFLKKVYLPRINQMGPRIEATLDRHGFFPAGGGRIVVHVEPSKVLAGFDLRKRGDVLTKTARILISNLPLSIARREADTLIQKLQFHHDDVTIETVQADGPGNLVFAEIQCQYVTELVTSFGRVGASAERVADEVVKQVRSYLKSSAPVGEYFADQLLLPLGLSAAQSADCGVQRGGSFKTHFLSRHAMTHIDVIKALLPVEIHLEDIEDGTVVSLLPRPAELTT